MFGNFEAQKKIDAMGITLEKALNDINILCQFPQHLIDVVYETDEDKNRVFETGENKYVVLRINFKDDKGEIKSARKQSIETTETELMKELESIRKEKSKYE